MAEHNGHASFWDDDTEAGSVAESSRASPSRQSEAVHIGVQQDGVFAKAENGTDDTFSYIKRSGLKLRNAQGSTASLDTLDEPDDGQGSQSRSASLKQAEEEGLLEAGKAGNSTFIPLETDLTSQQRAAFSNVYMEKKRRARWRTSVCLNLAMVFERADEVILPAAYSFVARSFAATPSDLANITLARALVQAVCSPLGGVLGHYGNRIWVITVGCLIWGVMTVGFSISSSLREAIFFWAINGLGLSLVIPNVQSVTADFYDEKDRGKVFGTLHLTSAAGAAFGGLYATNMGSGTRFGWEGWRVAFLLLGIISLSIGLANFACASEPRSFDSKLPSGLPARKAAESSTWAKFKATLWDIKSVVTVPTFAIIIVQGIVGNIPGQAMAFLTLYLQLLGMDNFRASLLVSMGMLAHAAGGQLGGFIGDYAAGRAPKWGRIFICQLSVIAGMLLTLTLLKGLPTQHASAAYGSYMMVSIATGLLNSWPAPACTNPIFSEVVPARLRTFIYAFDRSFEMAIAACAAPVVAKLAESIFGFDGTATTSGDVAHDLSKAKALSNSLVVMCAVPWSLCAVIFSGLYFTYSRDKASAQLKEAAAEQRGRLVQRNGFLRLEEDGDAEEKGGFDQKWQLLRTTPAQR
ncbi:g3569 [Coccomyxa viridis]|uniref:G3569 protein n=1 Tax=Coccomyxa viridis TaxID=1274662 RepID=A0ABP1FN43_9CHLO